MYVCVLVWYLVVRGLIGILLTYDCLFFFKQKSAYEMRISDWSSDVCSSDLLNTRQLPDDSEKLSVLLILDEFARLGRAQVIANAFSYEIGRASCRERECQYV